MRKIAKMLKPKLAIWRRTFLRAGLIITASLIVRSQETPRTASPKFSVAVEVVNVFVTVGKKGMEVHSREGYYPNPKS